MEAIDLPREWREYADKQDIYPPRVMIALYHTSLHKKYTLSIKGITGECKFTLISPKAVTAGDKGW